MLRKIMTTLGIAMILALMGSFLTPAQAWQTNVDCNEHKRSLGRSSGFVCAEVQWHRQADGTGFVIDNIQLTATPASAFEDSGLRVDGYGLALTDGAGNMVWSKAGVDCNIDDTGMHFYGMGDKPFKVRSLGYLEYTYRAYINNSYDREASTITHLG